MATRRKAAPKVEAPEPEPGIGELVSVEEAATTMTEAALVSSEEIRVAAKEAARVRLGTASVRLPTAHNLDPGDEWTPARDLHQA